MDKPLDAARYATEVASYPIYDYMTHMAIWQAHNAGPILWADNAIDETTCEALAELTETYPEWSGIDPGDRNAV